MKKVLSGALTFAVVALAQPKIELKDAWVREVPPTSKMSAAYMVIENKGKEADRLLDASNNASEITELHETAEGKMRRVRAIEVPAGGKVELKPGGLHIMLINLKKPLKEGDTVELTLKFEKSGEVKVQAPVRKGMGGQMHQHRHGY
ncbi:MAG: copper chaperone PCu(A)C [Aquificaceae bacterium]|jgi:copper(I)-binding protein|uniref:copper chaperone PCu(A)C n=1 Tax=Hydrogenobacter sp. Uz 6-8 TaxID=3384828 RepID=UPI0030AC486A